MLRWASGKEVCLSDNKLFCYRKKTLLLVEMYYKRIFSPNLMGLHLPFAIIAGIKISIKNWQEHILIYLAILYWILIQSFCVAGMRYRMPIEFALILYSSAGMILTFFKKC